MPIPATWLERHRQRHDWALQAFDRFVHELAPEVSDQVRRTDQVTVVVYGATQVGKTTLILDLLGLASNTRDEVARVLRGGQAVGKSDPIGGLPAERPVSPADVVATIFHSLGLDPKALLPGPAGRPFPLVDFGADPIKELFT